MKTAGPRKAHRGYRQKARAAATEASSKRIFDAFHKRAETGSFESITLDSVAQDAGVTVQTVVRKFGGKAGLLEAASEHLTKDIENRRSTEPGNIDQTVEGLTEDYEVSGRLVLHLLDQEARHPVLKPTLDLGRKWHRRWIGGVFAATLDPLPPARREALLDSLVVATDVYVWKLVRLDMGRPVSAFKALVKRLLLATVAAK